MKTKTYLNPDHNIWKNHGTYWCHYTIHEDDYTKKRVCVSLGTKDIEIARALRDVLMDAIPKTATNIPRMRGQAMPDSTPETSENEGCGFDSRRAHHLPPDGYIRVPRLGANSGQ